MDEDRRAADPLRRARLLSPPSGQPQPPRAPAPLAMDLASQYRRRLASPLVLPPMAPGVPAVAPGSGGFSAFSSYLQAPPPALAPAPGAGSHLARTLSQPPFLSMGPLAPLPYAGPAAGAVQRSPPSTGAPQQGPSTSGLPPLGAGHRRSRSDFFVGFARPNQLPLPAPPAAEECSRSVDTAALEELFRSYRDSKGTAVHGASGSGEGPSERNVQLGGQMSGQRAWSPADSSDNEAESWATSGGGASQHPRHGRSLSVDSIMGSLNFGALGQVSPRLPPPSPGPGAATLPPPTPGAGAGGSLQRTGSGPSGSGGGVAALAAAELANNGEFSEAEMKKIMANDRLAEIALADPKRVKRILANRISAAKSKERKVKYMGELERKVHVLQMEASTLSAKLAMGQSECDALKTENNEMKIRLHALEQQQQLKDALNEALGAELQRLRQASGETSDPRAPSGSHQHMHRQITQQQLLQLQRPPSEPEQAHQQQQQTQELEQFKAQQKQWNN